VNDVGLVHAVTDFPYHGLDVLASLHLEYQVFRLFGRKARENNAVDQGRRLLVVHADVGRVIQANLPVERCLAERATNRLFKCFSNGVPSFHDGHRAVVQIHGILSKGLFRKEMIKGNYTVHINL